MTRNHASEPAWLSRALRPITEVRQGEATTVLLLTANVFLLLSAYYVIKPLREDLILAMASGAEYKSWLSGGIALALFVIVPVYGWLVDRLPRIKLVSGVTLAFAAQLLLFYFAIGIPSVRANLGFFFFGWVGVFNVMVVAQFWGYANDLYEKEQGDRLFALVALGASVGAAVGSKVAKVLVQGLGEPSMLLVAAGLLTICAGLYWLVERRDGGPATEEPASSRGKPQPSKKGGFGLVLSHRYLLLIALFALIYNWVNSNSEYMLSKLIKADAAALVTQGKIKADEVGSAIGAAYADFFFYVNVAGVLAQTFLVSRLVRWLRLPAAFLFLPVIAFGNAMVFAFVPIVAVAKATKTAENATDYSLNNTLKQMLWLVTSPDMKYKAKQVVDTFCVRMGDVFSAFSVILAVNILHFSVQRFAWISIVLGAVWLAIALAIGRIYHGLEERKEKLGA
ncbi:MAG TPA: MFS transporter [Polyangiaceae bacterium]|nr:MFS transporter [Polyangiaceae bacterium]